jgi:hypothetical protein
MKTWEENHLQAKARGLRGNQFCQHLDLGLLASIIKSRKILVKTVVLCYSSPSKLI